MDWKDIALHVVLALVGITVLHFIGVPAWIILTLNTVIWPARELWQKRNAPRDFFTFHVWLEWVPAVAVGFIIYGAI